LAPIVGRESPSESLAANPVRSGLCSREHGLSQVSSTLLIGGAEKLTGSSGSLVSSPLLRTTARFHHSKSERRSLAFPACPPWSWRFHTGPTRDSPDSSDHSRDRSRGPHDLRLFVRDTSRFARPPYFFLFPCWLTSKGWGRLLSWGFPKISSPPASAPHVRTALLRSQASSGCPPSAVARSCQPSRAIRPCRSSRLRRFHMWPLAGLLHPATGPEVRPVSDLKRHRPRASPRSAPDSLGPPR